MKSLALTFSLALSLAVNPCMAVEPNGDWEKLFDGKLLAGWTATKGTPPGNGWKVEDGNLVLDGAGGNIISAKEYSSFELEWEWKISPGGNNGVKYWVTAVDGKSWLGIEYQMIDDQRHLDGMRGGSHTTASIYDIVEPAKDKVLNLPGEWNSSKVMVKDGKIQHFLNGKLACEADTTTEQWKKLIAASKFKNQKGFAPGKGRIMLTDHGDKCWFRNIRIRNL